MPRSTPAAAVGSRLAAITRWHPQSPELDILRRQLRYLALSEHVQRAVDLDPPFTSEQVGALVAALRSTEGGR